MARNVRTILLWTASISAVLFLATQPTWGAPSLYALQDSFANVAAKAKPAVVNITAIHDEQGYIQAPNFFFGAPEDLFEDFFRGMPNTPRMRPYRLPAPHGTGSGIIIDERGYVLTNEHVIRGATEIKIAVTQQDGKQKTYSGKVVGKDANMDLAVLKIQTPGTYPYLKLGDSSKIRVGDWAIAIGSPFELEQTLTVGVISAVRQSLLIEGRRYQNLIQTDASINRGNSGGPLLNIDGDVIGINTAIFSPSGASAGIGFAIAVNEAKEVIDALLEGKAVQRGWLGVDLAPIDEVIQKRFDLKSAEGALVNSVMPDSPASKAGLQRGDVILKLDGEATESPADLARKVARLAPGKKASIEIFRQGKTKDISVTLGERPEWAEGGGFRRPEPKEGGEEGVFQWEGLSLTQADEGVLVQQVDRSSRLGGYILEGDQIKGANQTPISTLEDFKHAAPGLRLAEGVVFDILRQGQPMYISVQLKE